ncbi:YhgE/Pip domain-containing protein [Rhodococcus sp. 1168]|uniref:YhgE/Pip domain-containing protein n=1 Tax=Rhodococcus sp. 1168 TaxID=2018041 RepID=UPI000A0D33F6|nr:YhgE/Pip domain-containing protein [Rhodococcus sp. 1168]ORI15417.1 hypothetical protein BJI47_14055 [Rhodococcus sp. 1168]
MRNVFRVLSRDVKRLALVRKAWIVILGVMITPSLYAWVNISAFWDPFSETANVSVAVVNQDEGGTSTATGDVDVGSQLIDQLEENDQLGWQFMDENDAMEAVRSGSSYAAIIIPPDFTRDLLSITSGAFTPPTLTYYVNEKANAVAPKITDVGATTLDTQVNSTFVSVVAKAVTEELTNAGDNVERKLKDAQSNTVDTLDRAVGTVASARERIGDIRDGLSGTRGGLTSAGDTLGTVDATLGEVQTAVGQARQIADEAQQELADFTGSLTTAYVSGATLLADAASTLNGSVARVTSGLERAGVAVGSGLDDADEVVARTGEALGEVQALLAATVPNSELSARLSEAVTGLQDRIPDDQNILARVQQLNSVVAEATTAIRNSADAIDTAAQAAGSSARSVRDVLLLTGPELNGAMSRLSASAGALSSAIDSQRAQLGQAQSLLTSLGGQLDATSTALDALDGNLAGVEAGLDRVRTDVVALSTADAWDTLGTLTGLDAEQIAQFMASPVEVDEHPVFPVAAYGSAMAPLFANLSLWIGAFVLVVIFKLEVDEESIDGLTVRQAYLGRWMLLAAMGVVQALVLSIGNLVIGVETVGAFVFVATSVLIGLAYLSIIYALSVALGYVGKGLCILLVIVQIPGAAGLYPIELMPGFFRALYPALPFTYGIDAMRETISGFYGDHYWKNMAALAVFVALSFILGLVLRTRLGNFALLFSRKIATTQLFATEDVHITGRRYQLPQIIHALSNGGRYRQVVRARARRFRQNYPTLLRATFAVTLVVMLSLGLLAWLIPGGKAPLLGLWVLFSLLIIGFLVMLEYVEQSIGFAEELGGMSDAELRRELVLTGTGHDARIPSTSEVEEEREIPEVDPDGRVERGERE